MKNSIVAIHQISRAHANGKNKRWILENISIDLGVNEKISLVGPNGSGKTTLLRILLGIEPPDHGSIKPAPLYSCYRVGYIPQDYRNALFPWLSMRKNLAMSLNDELEDLPREIEEEYRILSGRYRLSIDLDKYPYQLSGGEQQIFLLLRALLSRPKILLLDEPLSAVDFGRKLLIREHLATWLSENEIAAVFATHDFEEAIMLADRVVILARDSPCIKTVMPIDLDWPRSAGQREGHIFKEALEVITRELL